MSIDKYEELKRRLLNLSFAWNAIPPQKIKEAISEVDVYISGGCKEVTSVTTTTNAPEVNEVCVHCGLSVAFHVDGTDCNNQTGNKFTPRQSAPEKDVREYNATIMSIRNLEKRLEKLEQAAGGEECTDLDLLRAIVNHSDAVDMFLTQHGASSIESNNRMLTNMVKAHNGMQSAFMSFEKARGK